MLLYFTSLMAYVPLPTISFRRPYNLYCVGGDVKPCSINQSTHHIKVCVFMGPLHNAHPQSDKQWLTRPQAAYTSSHVLTVSVEINGKINLFC